MRLPDGSVEGMTGDNREDDNREDDGRGRGNDQAGSVNSVNSARHGKRPRDLCGDAREEGDVG